MITNRETGSIRFVEKKKMASEERRSGESSTERQERTVPTKVGASSVLASACSVNLTLSTLVNVFLTRSIFAPNPLSFIIGWPASELVHFIGFAQATNLLVVNWLCPSLFDGFMTKVMLLINFYCFSRQVRAFGDLLASRADFSSGLQKGGIEPKSGRSLILFLASLIPLGAVARRGKRLRTFTEPYCSIETVDPELVKEWNGMSRELRMAQAYIGRDSATQWMSLDITVTEILPNPGAPVLLYIHGGGWTIGSKFFAAKAALDRIASRGIVVVSINYRLAPERAFPTQIIDCKRALIYVRQHCHMWNGDSNKIFVCGESAGGHLAALVATTVNQPQFQPPEALYEDTSVAGCIPLYGVLDFTDEARHQVALHPPLIKGLAGGMLPALERLVMQIPYKSNPHEYDLASPMYYIKLALEGKHSPEFCPFMVVHGTRDALAAFMESKTFYDNLQQLRARHKQAPDVFVPVHGGQVFLY